MKLLIQSLATATATEREIADLTNRQSTLTADVEKLTSTGDVSDRALDDLVRKRGKLDLLPAAIAKREERLADLVKAVREQAVAVQQRCSKELTAQQAAGRARLDELLAPLIPDAKERAGILDDAVPLLAPVRAAQALCWTADYAAGFSGELPQARALVAAVEKYVSTATPLTDLKS